MKIEFYTPSHGVTEEFGGASLGFAGAEDANVSNKITCPFDINGVMVSGSYEDCLKNIPEAKYQAGIVLLGNAGNENQFIRSLADKVKAPLVGGSAATNSVTGESALILGRGEAAVFMINDDRYEVEAVSQNIHYDILSKHTISFSQRWIDTIDGCEAKKWLEDKKAELGVSEDDFEHLTFADEHGINVHLSVVDGRIFSGRDLAETLYLRYVPHGEVQKRIQAFYDDKDAVVFGCAGLKGILDTGLCSKGTGLFMFGEVCTVDGYSDFGNLMLSKIKITKK